MQSWFDRLIGQPSAPPSEVGTKPTAPVAPLPYLPPSAVHAPRWARRWRRLLSLGADAPIDEYLKVLLAAVPLAQFEPEDNWPDVLIGYGFAPATAAGGQITEGQILNPAGSGLLVVVDQVTLAQQTLAAELVFLYNTAALGTGRVGLPGDTRGIGLIGAGAGFVQAQISSDVPAAVPATASSAFWGVFVPAGGMLVIPTKIILPPGRALLVASGVQGVQSTTVGFQWREMLLPVA